MNDSVDFLADVTIWDPWKPGNRVLRYATRGRIAGTHSARIGATIDRRLELPVVRQWPTTEFTVAFWGRLDAGLTLSQPNEALSYAVPGSTNELLINLEWNGAGVWRQSLFIKNALQQCSIQHPDDHLWHHMTVTWRSVDGLTSFYRDGVLLSTHTFSTGQVLTGAGYLVLGQDQDAVGGGFDATQSWKGELDDVRVYTRALTAAEVLAVSRGDLVRSGLVLHQHFERPDNIGHDSSSAHNDMTNVGITELNTSVPSVFPSAASPLHYKECLHQPALMRRDLFRYGATQGATRIGYGDLILNNANGALDELIRYAFDGWPITIWQGHPDNIFPAEFTKVMAGTMESCEVGREQVTIKLRDKQADLNVALQTIKYKGDNVLPNGLEGEASDLKGKPKPICFGKVLNVETPCVNQAKLIYQAHDGVLASVDAVYDRGIQLQPAFTFTPAANCPIASVRGLAFGAGLWVAIGNAGEIYTSTDGEAWTSRTSGVATPLTGIVFKNNLFVVTGESNVLLTSPDGIVWTARTSGLPGGAILTYADWGLVSGASGVWIAGANNAGDGSNARVSRSTDNGVTWAAVVIPIPDTAFVGVRPTFGNGLFVLWGSRDASQNPVFIVSSSGATGTWSEPVNNWPVGEPIRGMVYGNGTFVGIQGTGAVARGRVSITQDGITWIQTAELSVASPLASTYVTPNNLVFLNGFFIVLGAGVIFGPVMVWSPDGVQWGLINVSAALSGAALSASVAAYDGNGKFLISGFGDEIGKGLVGTYASAAELLADSGATNATGQGPAPGMYKSYLAGGMFRLGAVPAGLVTADVTEGATAADRTAGQIFKRVLSRVGKTSLDYSADDVALVDSVQRAVLGYWTMEETTAAAVLDQIAATIGGWWGADRVGKFRIQRLGFPSGVPVISWTENQVLPPYLRRVATSDASRGIPAEKLTLRWGRVYTVQTTDLAGGVTQARRNIVGQEWREVILQDSAVKLAHLLAPQEIVETLFAEAADALAEADRQFANRKVPHDLFEFAVPADDDSVMVDLGVVIRLSHPRYQLVGGKPFVVLGLEPDGVRKEIQFTVWAQAGDGSVPPDCIIPPIIPEATLVALAAAVPDFSREPAPPLVAGEHRVRIVKSRGPMFRRLGLPK